MNYESCFPIGDSNMNEERLIKRLRRRCPDALEALMDRYIPYVSTVVWNILRYNMSKEDAEEVVSDVFSNNGGL